MPTQPRGSHYGPSRHGVPRRVAHSERAARARRRDLRLCTRRAAGNALFLRLASSRSKVLAQNGVTTRAEFCSLGVADVGHAIVATTAGNQTIHLFVGIRCRAAPSRNRGDNHQGAEQPLPCSQSAFLSRHHPDHRYHIPGLAKTACEWWTVGACLERARVLDCGAPSRAPHPWRRPRTVPRRNSACTQRPIMVRRVCVAPTHHRCLDPGTAALAQWRQMLWGVSTRLAAPRPHTAWCAARGPGTACRPRHGPAVPIERVGAE